MGNLYYRAPELKRYQVYLDSVYQDSFEEQWEAMQWIDDNEKRFQAIADDANEVINVRIYDEYNFTDLEEEGLVMVPTKKENEK